MINPTDIINVISGRMIDVSENRVAIHAPWELVKVRIVKVERSEIVRRYSCDFCEHFFEIKKMIQQLARANPAKLFG